MKFRGESGDDGGDSRLLIECDVYKTLPCALRYRFKFVPSDAHLPVAGWSDGQLLSQIDSWSDNKSNRSVASR